MDFPLAMVRWMDRHLKRRGVGTPEPVLVAYVTEGPRGGARLLRLGRWIALETWPGATSRTLVFGLDGKTLREGASRPGLVTVDTPVETGLSSGGWCRFGVHGEHVFERVGYRQRNPPRPAGKVEQLPSARGRGEKMIQQRRRIRRPIPRIVLGRSCEGPRC